MDETQQPLQFQQVRVAVELVGRVAVGCPLDAGLDVGQMVADQRFQRHALPRLQAHHQGKALLTVGRGTRLQQLGAVLVDHRLRHRMGAARIPAQALGQGRIQAPAHPLHLRRKPQGLGDRQPEGPFHVAGIQDHRFALGDGLAQLPLDLVFHLSQRPRMRGSPWSSWRMAALEMIRTGA